ncbi:MAG: DAK2 domain-containing protein [Firmicutes bacterium]|nr:DAK2 domain-containing protein [Bacillota bacterium]
MQVLTGIDLKRIITVAAQYLNESKDKVDALNVFPVPDGDTGTNMALTLSTAIRELDNLADDKISTVASAIARGSLMGARGNSGVILSQFFRGFSDGLANLTEATGRQLAEAFDMASQTTYKAVMKPVEGTMLTVGRELAAACLEATAEQELTPIEVWALAVEAGRKSLANTPNILPILKQAGVVDAGGEGLMVVFEGAFKALKGEIIEVSPVQIVTSATPVKEGISRIEGDLVNKYCTEFIIKGSNLDQEEIRATLQPLGESMLVVGDSDVVKVHIHTDRPGKVLDYCTGLGNVTEIAIDNMLLQNESITENENVLVFPNAPTVPPVPAEKKPIGLVAVVPGAGLAEIFMSLGVDKIVTGGQTMNPSTEELVNAVEEVNADAVIILPNNKNVIFAAQQVKELVDRPVEVVPTRSVPQGIGALMGFGLHLDLEENLAAMESAMEEVKTGEVTYAVRTTKAGDLEIEEHDIIGLAEGKIAVAGKSVNEVALMLLEELVDEDSSVISIYVGDNQDLADAEEFRATVEESFPDCDVEMHKGDQPLYYYIMSVE